MLAAEVLLALVDPMEQVDCVIVGREVDPVEVGSWSLWGQHGLRRHGLHVRRSTPCGAS